MEGRTPARYDARMAAGYGRSSSAGCTVEGPSFGVLRLFGSNLTSLWSTNWGQAAPPSAHLQAPLLALDEIPPGHNVAALCPHPHPAPPPVRALRVNWLPGRNGDERRVALISARNPEIRDRHAAVPAPAE